MLKFKFVPIILICLAAGSCSVIPRQPDAATPEAASPMTAGRDLPFGNPSKATIERDNYLLVHGSFTLSYNNSRGTLNWVAWRTRESDLGERLDRSDFEPDTLLPPGFRRITYFDYSGSGYDRGHMVPSADRFSDTGRNRETFVMTNIVPQARTLNQYPWNDLERYARKFARRGAETYTIAGVYGEKARLRGSVTVPTNCWKVIVVFDRGSVGEMTTRTQVIAVDMPNDESIGRTDWSRYVTSVDAIEARTGFDLFDLLPDDLEAAIESRTAFPVTADR